MKINSFLILCFTGLLPDSVSVLKTVPHHYDLIMTPSTWQASQAYCRAINTDLATVLSGTDWTRLKKVSTTQRLTAPAWIGVYNDIYNWRWSLNNISLTSTQYTNWYPGEPDNYYRMETCTIIAGYNQWYDISCYIIRPFICYDARLSGTARFVPVSSPQMTWPGAQVYCRTYYTDLATILNKEEDNICVQIKLNQGDSWIGLNRDMDTWKWSDGTYMSNLPWAPGQPDNLKGSEDCVMLSGGNFYDERCANKYSFFCHKIFPFRSQIIRLQVKSDGSVFDPAVQSSILEQVKLTLAKNGLLKDTTMTWRVQPDGNIFYKKKKRPVMKTVNPLKMQSKV